MTKERALMLIQNGLRINFCQSGVDIDQIAGLGPRRQFGQCIRQRIRVRLRLADFLGNRISIIGHIDPTCICRVGFRHLFGAVF